ncbi:FliH/SctL family protein [Craterilacuibacter sp. RT1T]|nr:FliH/SctL family protein [Craterilacuibacter sp. RT1T]
MKALSSNPIISAESLGVWTSWQPGVLGASAPQAKPPEPAPVAESGGVAAQAVADDAQATRDLLDSVIASASEPPLLTLSDPASSAIEAAKPESVPAAISYPTAAELEAIHQEAWQAGHDAGFAEGLADGHAEGLSLGQAEAKAQFELAWAPLAQLTDSLAGQLPHLEASLSQTLVALAVECGERLAQAHFVHAPQALEVLVREALASAVGELSQIRVRVHPEDAPVLEHFLSKEYPKSHIKWLQDAAISRGGCMIDTQLAHFDLTLETRQRALRAALGLALAGQPDE